MKRWQKYRRDYGEAPEIDAFLAEVLEISKRHGLSIVHEDGHGAFMVEEYDQPNCDWLMDAIDARESTERKST